MPQLRLVPVSEIEGGFGSGSESLGGLIDSIQAYGVLQPLLVRRLRGRYQLLAGNPTARFATASPLVSSARKRSGPIG